ncbi:MULTISPECIES: DUF6215 domain-containing protein [unclassified Streptomyces]|uniref:DUF6215 domain-containing protein n=1 Tax=unclassified Streptomyces TaxID=2593676 RepID=UPI00203024EE|nr:MULTISPECIES: DUF6215 domain-containing protein [unclassified Streptomyces]MCM1971106.1 DUF6215 domain-containing protein [Streptomyces sp. G1]MCX5128943.1 DUF6215 domain-containing protein [Streptomyces sp. NBC_00347]MCX5299482.1 DUF6215 domain-containing protein [Streptomyces sp. NBC_00193]
MSEDGLTITKGAAVRQGLAAVAVLGAMGMALWVGGESVNSSGEPTPVTCSHGEPEKTPAQTPVEAGHVSGAQLCEALHRPDLADLLGTPGEAVKNANGSGSTFKPVGSDEEIHTPSGKIEFETYTVNLRVADDGLKVATVAKLLGDGTLPLTVLGHPAAYYSDRTISISFNLADGSDASTGSGVPTRSLVVSRGTEDGGGTYELTLWRSDGGMPDDAVVLRVAETVLPTVPGWAAAG